MMALVHKLTTGQGQVIDVALYESAFSFTVRGNATGNERRKGGSGLKSFERSIELFARVPSCAL